MAVAPAGEAEARGGDAVGGGGDAEVRAVVRAGEADAGAGEVALGDDVVDGDVDVGEGAAELPPESKEGFFAAGWRVLRSEAVDDDVGGGQLVDRRLAFLVPDFLEPTADEGFVGFHSWWFTTKAGADEGKSRWTRPRRGHFSDHVLCECARTWSLK